MSNKSENVKLPPTNDEILLAKQKLKFEQVIADSVDDGNVKQEYYENQKKLQPQKFDKLVAESMIVEEITRLRTSVLIKMQDYFYNIFYTKNDPRKKDFRIVTIKGETILNIVEEVIQEELGNDEKNVDDYGYIVYESVMKWLDLEYIINNNNKQN